MNDLFTLIANVATIVGVALTVPTVLISCWWAERMISRQYNYQAYRELYAAASALWREGISIQDKKKANERFVLQPLLDAKDAFRNTFYGWYYVFARDDTLRQLFKDACAESRQIANTLDMSCLRSLREELERRLSG